MTEAPDRGVTPKLWPALPDGFSRKDMLMLISSKRRMVAGVVAFVLLPSGPTALAARDRNATGLPTYPHLTNAVMDPVPRDTLGHKCIHYAATSPDRLETVEAWYRQALAGATESDINKDSMYGDYFKLVGIRLTRGADLVTVYREENGRTTSVELFKCAERWA